MGADIVLGHPVFLNYYFVLDTKENRIAFVESTFTINRAILTPGAIAFLCLIGVILIGGLIGGIHVYKRYKRESLL